jgi:hypothetical protein
MGKFLAQWSARMGSNNWVDDSAVEQWLAYQGGWEDPENGPKGAVGGQKLGSPDFDRGSSPAPGGNIGADGNGDYAEFDDIGSGFGGSGFGDSGFGNASGNSGNVGGSKKRRKLYNNSNTLNSGSLDFAPIVIPRRGPLPSPSDVQHEQELKQSVYEHLQKLKLRRKTRPNVRSGGIE